MIKKRVFKELNLRKETIRKLTEDEAEAVHGGKQHTCNTSCAQATCAVTGCDTTCERATNY